MRNNGQSLLTQFHVDNDMPSGDLVEEFAEAVAAVTSRYVEMLEGLGVPSKIACGLLPDWPMVGVTHAVTHECGLYTPFDGGSPLYVCPCIEGDEIIDLIAWKPSTPKRWWMRRGCAVLLNPQEPSRIALAQSWAEDEANVPRLLIHETPLNWLRAWCEGVVILDWQRCVPFQLSSVRQVECESTALAKRLRAAYAINDRPRIFYHEKLDNSE